MLSETPKKKSMEKYEVFAQSFPEGRIATPRHASLHRPTTRGGQAAAGMYVSAARLAFFTRARDNGQLEDRHYDVLRVPLCASDAEITKAFKREMLQAHPDKNDSENANGSEKKSRLLNEARERLLDKEKRAVYAQKNSTLPPFSLDRIGQGDIVAIQGLESNPEYNGMHGRVVEISAFVKDAQLELQHRWQQFDLGYTCERKTLQVDKAKLRRLYGDEERKNYAALWSTYYPEGSRVTIDNAQETPWYNGIAAEVCGYNYDLARYEVCLHPFDDSAERLAFKPHNIPPAVRDPSEGLREALRVEKAMRASAEAALASAEARCSIMQQIHIDKQGPSPERATSFSVESKTEIRPDGYP